MNHTYTRLRRLADIQSQLDIEAVQGQLNLQPPTWHYVPRAIAPTVSNEQLPAFVKIQAE